MRKTIIFALFSLSLGACKGNEFIEPEQNPVAEGPEQVPVEEPEQNPVTEEPEQVPVAEEPEENPVVEEPEQGPFGKNPERVPGDELSLEKMHWELIWLGYPDGEKKNVELTTQYGLMIDGSNFRAKLRCNYLQPFWSVSHDAEFLYVGGGYITVAGCFYSDPEMRLIVDEQDGFYHYFFSNANQIVPIAYEIEGDYLTLTHSDFRSLVFRPYYEGCENPAPLKSTQEPYRPSYTVHFHSEVNIEDTVDNWSKLYPDLGVVEMSELDAKAVLESSDQTFRRISCTEGVESVSYSGRGSAVSINGES